MKKGTETNLSDPGPYKGKKPMYPIGTDINEMSYEKCHNCEFCTRMLPFSISEQGFVVFICQITGKKLKMKGCIKRGK